MDSEDDTQTYANDSATSSPTRTELAQRRSRPVRDPHEERRKREAWALEVVKGMRKSPSAPEPPPAPLRPTYKAVPDAPGWVYFAYCAGRIKIGYTANLENRLPQYSTHAPMPFVLLLAIGGDEDDEDAYHEEFAADRVHNEWFRLSPELRGFLDREINGGDAFTLLFEAECDYRDAAQADLAWINQTLNEVKELSHEPAAV